MRAEDAEGLLALAGTLGADLVVVGPEGPLVAGVADVLRHSGIPVFGPSAEAARIEGSKSFAKDVMACRGRADRGDAARSRDPCVVKADGLASGKGVFVCQTPEELDEALRAAQRSAASVVIEELLEGREVSLFALSDGRTAIAARRRDRTTSAIGDGDSGPNTGGWAPTRRCRGSADADALVERCTSRCIDELARRGSPFVGCLFAGLMLDADGPGARVQRALRRSGDAGADAAPRRRSARGAGRGRRAASSPGGAPRRRERAP